MKNESLVIIILFLFIIKSYAYAQTVVCVKGKNYNGYIFPKEYSIWGFPPENHRYTPSLEDVVQVEKILKDSIISDYVKSNQKLWKREPINKKTLRKYVRQYVGYITDNREIIIHIYLSKDIDADKEKFSKDIITVLDGGSKHWSIYINITTKKLFDMRVNGIS